MSGEVHGLEAFYARPHGQAAARLIGARVAALWPDCTGMDLLGLGWTQPYMGLWSRQRGRRIALVPASFGPSRGGVRGDLRGSALTDDHELPLPDRSLDRILLIHGLEASERARPLLRECWRVLRDDGRLLVVAPNRLGWWSLFEHTPFGQGRPYSQGQLARLLEGQLFRVTRREAALFVPPFPWSFALAGARLWELWGRAVAKRFAGVTMIEAEKDLFAALPAGAAAALGRRVAAPLPAGYARAGRATGNAPDR